MAGHRIRRALVVLLVLVAVASGCGSDDDGSSNEATADAAAAAAGHETRLVLTDELGSTEMLDVRTGTITSLDAAVSGDRAVLLWYWAPD